MSKWYHSDPVSKPFIATVQVNRRVVIQKEIYELEDLDEGDMVEVTVKKIKKGA